MLQRSAIPQQFSSSLESIPSERSWAPNNPAEAPWQFSEKEVTISDEVLGRGAFGEVRVAKWRNINVAAKRLHVLDTPETDQPSSSWQGVNQQHESLMQEMKLLSKLRHPNLVLFLGVCFDDTTRLPTTILTELMPSSLYSILEEEKVKLALPDILDISLDVATGIDYLHCHIPPVVHRDISAKNILIGGNRAKITDLGQSKMVGTSVKSRQTGMPGAMAYSAPEVLTGRYTDKIDVFSFGVLLIQMCTGEYPRIEKREEQLAWAVNNHPSLERILTSCIAYGPEERPSARSICDHLCSIRNNDRYYPPARRTPPQSDLGVMGRKWMNETIEMKIKETKLALEQTSRRLAAEEARWRDEADRADNTNKDLKEIEFNLNYTNEKLQQQTERAEAAEVKNVDFDTRITKLSKELEEAQKIVSQLEQQKQNAAQAIAEKDKTITSLRKFNNKSNDIIEELSKTIHASKESEAAAIEKEKEARLMLEMHEEQSKELESRLEQALMRWKKEKENTFAQSVLSAKFRSQNGHLIDANKKLEYEVKMVNERLSQYEHLDGPDELQARLKDHENDGEVAKETISKLTKDVAELEERMLQGEEKYKDIENELRESSEDQHRLKKVIMEKDEAIMSYKSSIEKIQKNYAEIEELVAKKEIEMRGLEKEHKQSMTAMEIKITELEKIVHIQTREKEKAEYIHTEGTNALLLAHDAFLPESAESEFAGQHAGQAHHDPGVDARGADFNQDDSMDAFEARRNASLQKVFGSGVSPKSNASNGHTPPGTAGARQDEPPPESFMTIEQLRKRDISAKQEVQHTVDLKGYLGLVRLLRENMQNEYVLWRATRALRDIVHSNEEIRNDVVRNKADEVILNVIDSYPNSAVVQSQAIRLIGSLSYGNDVVRRRVGENSGIKRIVAAMDNHITDETVQLHACTTLTNLFHNSHDNRFRFLESSGVEVLAASMERYIHSVNIQRRACWALLTLVSTDEIARLVSETGAVMAIVNAMMNHRLDSGVQQFGCWAMSNLAVAGDDVKRKLKKSGCLELCRIAIESHPDDHEVIRQARNAVGSLGPPIKQVTPLES